jgi:hypothetical protein
VEIVQNQDAGAGTGNQSIDQAVDLRIEGHGRNRLEYAKQVVLQAREKRHERAQQVLEQSLGVVISAIQREPGGREVDCVQPAAYERGFAIAGGGGRSGRPAREGHRTWSEEADGSAPKAFERLLFPPELRQDRYLAQILPSAISPPAGVSAGGSGLLQ